MTNTLPMQNVDEPNGVPVEKLRGTIAKLTDNPALAAFQFTAKNSWVEGTATRSTIHEWYGAGSDQVHVAEFSATADHPTLGHGHGPTPQEYVLHALAACVAAGVATTAANRGIALTKIETVARGKIDVRGSTSSPLPRRSRSPPSKSPPHGGPTNQLIQPAAEPHPVARRDRGAALVRCRSADDRFSGPVG